MLKPERMVDDVLMALSMYFAAAIKDRLMRSGQDVWTLIMLLAGTMLWWKVETCCAASKHAQQTAPTDDLALFYDVAFEVVYIVSQTLTFLVLQFTVHLFDASVDERRETDGVTDVEQYATLSSWVGLRYQLFEWLALRTSFSLAYEFPHFITFADAGRDLDGQDQVQPTNSQGFNEFNPVYADALDFQNAGSLGRTENYYKIAVFSPFC